MDIVELKGRCPICGKGPIRPLALDCSVFVAKDAGTQRVGGLIAYQCTQQLHVFFVMARDVDEAQELNSA